MQAQFYISHDGVDLGPWALDEIAARLKKGELSATDYIYVDEKQDWVLLMEHTELQEAVKAASKPKKPTAPFGETHKEPVPTQPAPATGEEWFILKGENRYGPFTYLDVLHMLQEKSIYEYDYVWKSPMESWARVAECSEFHPEKVRSLVTTHTEGSSEVFFRRRHARLSYHSSVIVHNNKNVWKGESVEISEGGAGVVMFNSMLLPGEKIYLHFKPMDGVPPFNALCEIVSKKYEKEVSGKETPLVYGVKFISIHNNAKTALKEYIKKAA